MWKDDILSWIYHGDNNWQNNHEIRNKTNLGCSKLHLQWSPNWWHNQTVNNWLSEQHNQPLNPLIATIKVSMLKPQYWVPFLERPTSMVLGFKMFKMECVILFKMECVIYCSTKDDFKVFFFGNLVFTVLSSVLVGLYRSIAN